MSLFFSGEVVSGGLNMKNQRSERSDACDKLLSGERRQHLPSSPCPDGAVDRPSFFLWDGGGVVDSSKG